MAWPSYCFGLAGVAVGWSCVSTAVGGVPSPVLRVWRQHRCIAYRAVRDRCITCRSFVRLLLKWRGRGGIRWLVGARLSRLGGGSVYGFVGVYVVADFVSA